MPVMESRQKIATLRCQAKCVLRRMFQNWISDDIEMQNTLVILADRRIKGIIDDKMIETTLNTRMIDYIACNGFHGEDITRIVAVWELIKEIIIEEAKATQN